VDIASTKTTSDTSSSECSLSISWKGGAGWKPSPAICTRLGPKLPMCSQILAEPGPPLYRNDTGRPLAFSPSFV
jgi:hypothetical protein